MSKILCIPDVHGRKFWRQAIADNIRNVDKIIFLGDYLDPYQNEIDEYQETMECNDFYDVEGLSNMLNDIISLKKNDPNKYILLTGNHTDGYIWNDFNAPTRKDKINYNTYHNIFLENLNLFNLVWIEDNVIFSHAGLIKEWCELVWRYFEYPISEFHSIMDVACLLNDISLPEFEEKHIYLISETPLRRNGWALNGSCEWADITEHVNMRASKENIVPKGEDGIYQIFGHTQLKKELITNKWACLDCRKPFIIDTITHNIEDGSNSSL